SFRDFRITTVPMSCVGPDTVTIPREVADALLLESGDSVRLAPPKEGVVSPIHIEDSRKPHHGKARGCSQPRRPGRPYPQLCGAVLGECGVQVERELQCKPQASRLAGPGQDESPGRPWLCTGRFAAPRTAPPAYPQGTRVSRQRAADTEAGS